MKKSLIPLFGSLIILKKALVITSLFFIFEGNIFSQEVNNDIEKSKGYLVDSTNIQSYIDNYMNNNQFFTSPSGGCFIRLKSRIYKLSNALGDEWTEVYKDKSFVSFDSNNPKVIYSLGIKDKFTNTSLLSKSMNNGNNWIDIENGLPSENLIKEAISLNPKNSPSIFLLTNKGVYRTLDGGFRWEQFLMCKNPKQLFCCSKTERKYILLTQDSLILSNDGGHTWNNISDRLSKHLAQENGHSKQVPIQIFSISLINHLNNSILFTYTDNGIFKTSDDGATWIEANKGISKSNVILSAFIYNDEIYIGGYNSIAGMPKLFKTKIDSINWEDLDLRDIEMGAITGIYKDYDHGGVFISTSNDRIAYLDSNLNVLGLNYGLTPHTIVKAYQIALTDQRFTQYAIITNNRSYDIETRDQLWSCTNNNFLWKELSINKSKYERYTHYSFIKVSPIYSNLLWISSDTKISMSEDGGKSWFNIFEGHNHLKDMHFCLSNDLSFRNILHYTEGNSPSPILYRYDMSTQNSMKILDDDVNLFVMAQDNNKKILTDNGKLTIDGGWTWNQIVNFKDLLIKETYSSEKIIPISIIGSKITIGYCQSNELCFLSSDDDGLTWNGKSDRIKTYNNFNKIYVNEKNCSNMIFATIEETSRNPNIYKLNVYQTKDSGKNIKLIYSYIDTDNLILDDYITTIYSEHIGENEVIFLGLSTGSLIYSKNDGSTWEGLGGIRENKIFPIDFPMDFPIDSIIFNGEVPKKIVMGQSFNLVYSSNVEVEDLRIAELSDFFDILYGPSTSLSSSTTIVNGKYQSTTSYGFTYTLKSKKTGTFTIPSATAIIKGFKYKSNPLTVNVIPADKLIR